MDADDKRRNIALLLCVLLGVVVVGGVIMLSVNWSPYVAPSWSSSQNATLEKIVAERHSSMTNSSGYETTGWSVKWQGNDEVTMSYAVTATKECAGQTWSYKETLMLFPTTQDATTHLTSVDKSGYNLTTPSRDDNTTYSNIQNPSTFHFWLHTQLNSYDNSDFSEIHQYDNLLIFDSGQQLTSGQC
jgi:hypothetical protein